MNTQDNYALIETGYHGVRWNEPVIHELSAKRLKKRNPAAGDPEIEARVGDVLERIPAAMPASGSPCSSGDNRAGIMRHFLRLSQETFGFDSGISVGLGTCTMKYSPKVNEKLGKVCLL